MHTLKNSSGSGEAAVEAGASAFSSAAGGGSRLAGLSAFASPSRLTGFSTLPEPAFPSSPPAAAAAAAALAFSESPMKSRGLGALAWMASFTAAVRAAWMPFFSRESRISCALGICFCAVKACLLAVAVPHNVQTCKTLIVAAIFTQEQ